MLIINKQTRRHFILYCTIYIIYTENVGIMAIIPGLLLCDRIDLIPASLKSGPLTHHITFTTSLPYLFYFQVPIQQCCFYRRKFATH